MSLSALLTAVRNQVRTELSVDANHCDVQPDAQPPPFAGSYYIAIHPTRWASEAYELDSGLREEYDIACSLTYRLPHTPVDRSPTENFLKAVTGMEARAREIMVAVHLNYTVFTAANALISGTNKLTEPLRWTHNDPFPQTKMGDWVWSDNPAQIRAALVLGVYFARARRFQTDANME